MEDYCRSTKVRFLTSEKEMGEIACFFAIVVVEKMKNLRWGKWRVNRQEKIRIYETYKIRFVRCPGLRRYQLHFDGHLHNSTSFNRAMKKFAKYRSC